MESKHGVDRNRELRGLESKRLVQKEKLADKGVCMKRERS